MKNPNRQNSTHTLQTSMHRAWYTHPAAHSHYHDARRTLLLVDVQQQVHDFNLQCARVSQHTQPTAGKPRTVLRVSKSPVGSSRSKMSGAFESARAIVLTCAAKSGTDRQRGGSNAHSLLFAARKLRWLRIKPLHTLTTVGCCDAIPNVRCGRSDPLLHAHNERSAQSRAAYAVPVHLRHTVQRTGLTVEQLQRSLLALLLVESAQNCHRQLNILERRHRGNQVESLEHEPCAQTTATRIRHTFRRRGCHHGRTNSSQTQVRQVTVRRLLRDALAEQL